jgi:2-polyprenyl-3-methyl-5-hydroxy-6-metoxy-1,4-benzoquinol methylase
MKNVSCIICGQDKTKIFDVNNGFNIVQCVNDDLIYVNPQPEEKEFNKFYAEQYFFNENNSLGYGDYLEYRPAIEKNYSKIIDKIKKIKTAGKFWDIGCAFGFVLNLARKSGFEVYGNDLNLEAVKYAKEILHFENVELGYLADLVYDKNNFDVVTMFGTIEHFQNPQKEIDETKKLLKTGGLLAVLTVDMDSLIGHRTIKPPEHLYYFGKKTMRKFLEKNNFEIIDMTPRFGLNLFYFTLGDFTTRFFNYFYRLANIAFARRSIAGLRDFSLDFFKKTGLKKIVIPAVDGQFLTIAQYKG